MLSHEIFKEDIMQSEYVIEIFAIEKEKKIMRKCVCIALGENICMRRKVSSLCALELEYGFSTTFTVQ